MKIAVDIDGTLANFHEPANFWLASRAGVPPMPVAHWHWYRDYDDGEKLFKKFWQMVRRNPDWWLTLPVLPVAQEAVWFMQEQGHEVFYLTARDDRYHAQTAVWLARQHFSGPVTHNHEKHLDTHTFDLLIDDCADHVSDVLDHGGDAVLMDRPWNREARLPRGVGWGGMLRNIVQKAS